MCQKVGENSSSKAFGISFADRPKAKKVKAHLFNFFSFAKPAEQVGAILFFSEAFNSQGVPKDMATTYILLVDSWIRRESQGLACKY
jgi:hypothetical protein